MQSFESWMHKWLLFEKAKNPKLEDHKAIPAEKGIGDGTAELGKGQGGGAAHREPSPLSRHRPICSVGSLCFLAVGTSEHLCPLPVGHLG